MSTRDEKRNHIRRTIDVNGFNWLVWAVAASGFFTDSYNLFATNVILQSLAYVYWRDESALWHETVINSLTLSGSVVGQLVFGYLADKFGRTRLYGIELVIVIFSTIGFSSSATGYGNSMSMLAMLTTWRFIMGIGIGAEYPLSAVITTEQVWAPTSARARMMGAVSLMQPVGQLVAHLVGLCVLVGYGRTSGLRDCTDPAICGPIVDKIWRWVTGVGAIPALLAIIFRFMMPDSGLYDLDVKNEGDRAVKNTYDLYGGPTDASQQEIPLQQVLVENSANQAEPAPPNQFSRREIYKYFWEQGNWRYLLGTSACWFCLDFAFYGIGMGNPRTLAKLWTFYPSGKPLDKIPSWNADFTQPNSTIYQALRQGAKQNIITVSIGSLLGNILYIMLIDYMPRKQFLMWSFLWLAFLLAITGSSFLSIFYTHMHAVSIVLIALCYFSFNFGANILIFIIPAEIFPTRYRCTCHGISAAAGKLGSVLVQVILPHMSFGGVLANDPNSNGLGWVLITFGFVMAFGALFTWVWIPEVQKQRDDGSLELSSINLEDLGEGLIRATKDGQVIGFRSKFKEAAEPWRARLRKICGQG